jgi:hypothetical protein
MVSVPTGTGVGPFCQSTITCSGASQSATAVDTLYVSTLGWCQMQGRGKCPAGSVPNNSSTWSIYAGDGCIKLTATITGGSCIIPIGASSCTVPVSFTTTNLSVSQAGLFDIARTGASSNSYYNGFVYGGTSYMSIPGRAADQADVSVGGGTPITLRVNSMSGASTFTVDGSGIVTGNCATGSAWNGSMCTPSTVSGSVTANSCTVAFGQSTCTSPISWTSSGYNPDTVNLFGCTQPSCSAQTSNQEVSGSLTATLSGDPALSRQYDVNGTKYGETTPLIADTATVKGVCAGSGKWSVSVRRVGKGFSCPPSLQAAYVCSATAVPQRGGQTKGTFAHPTGLA